MCLRPCRRSVVRRPRFPRSQGGVKRRLSRENLHGDWTTLTPVGGVRAVVRRWRRSRQVPRSTATSRRTGWSGGRLLIERLHGRSREWPPEHNGQPVSRATSLARASPRACAGASTTPLVPASHHGGRPDHGRRSRRPPSVRLGRRDGAVAAAAASRSRRSRPARTSRC